MKVPWKIVGLAGVAGVAATTGVVVARKRREHTEYDPDELRDKLHSRVAEAAEGEPLGEPDTKIHTSPHGDPVAQEDTAADGEAAPGAVEGGGGAAQTSSAS
jgi:hypothetical protein